MTSLIFNNKKIDYKKQPMFFGEEGLNIQRYDDVKYPVFEKSTNTQLGFFWRPEEISLQKDRNDYLQFQDGHKFIFTSNLKRQILLDSVQGRGPNIAFLPYVSLPELEAAIIMWTAFETIHSRSYQHMLRNLYANPGEIFDTVLDDDYINECAQQVVKPYDDFVDYAQQYTINGKGTLRELKKKLYLALVNINALESVRFYVSFACNFCFAENKLMEGTAKIMSLIARDEAQHKALTQNIINKYRFEENDVEMLEIIAECKEEAEAIFMATARQEIDWGKYMFGRASMLGLNAAMMEQYIMHITNKSMTSIGLTPGFPKTDNPLSWMDNWLSSKNVQVAPQETEITSYRVGSVKRDIAPDMFADFVL